MVVMCSIREIITIVIIADMAHLAILMNGNTLMDIIITAILIIRGIIMMDIVERNKEVDIITTNRNEYICFIVIVFVFQMLELVHNLYSLSNVKLTAASESLFSVKKLIPV